MRKLLVAAGLWLLTPTASALSCFGWANPEAAIASHDIVVEARVIHTGTLLKSFDKDGLVFWRASVLEVSEVIKGEPSSRFPTYEGYYSRLPPEEFQGVLFLSKNKDDSIWLNGCSPILTREEYDNWQDISAKAPECPSGDKGIRSAADYIVNEGDDPDEPVLPWTCNPDR